MIPNPSRPRRRLKCLGLVLCVSIVALCAISGIVEVNYVFRKGPLYLCRASCGFSIMCGWKWYEPSLVNVRWAPSSIGRPDEAPSLLERRCGVWPRTERVISAGKRRVPGARSEDPVLEALAAAEVGAPVLDPTVAEATTTEGGVKRDGCLVSNLHKMCNDSRICDDPQ